MAATCSTLTALSCPATPVKSVVASPYRTPDTLVTADAGYHRDADMAQLLHQHIPAMVADTQMRYRDERFAEKEKYKGMAHNIEKLTKTNLGNPRCNRPEMRPQRY